MNYSTSRLVSFIRLIAVMCPILVMLVVPGIGQAQQHNLGGPDQDFVHGHTDSVPNFGKNYDAINLSNGHWSNPSVWQGGKIPTNGSIVRIKKGTTIIYNVMTAEVDTIGIEGTLRFSPAVNTRLKVANLLVYRSGYLEIGTEATPIPSHLTAEVIIANKPLDLVDDSVGVFDPEQFGRAC